MNKMAHPGPVQSPQLSLQFDAIAPGHDLAYYVGICNVFSDFHGRWPDHRSSEAEFAEARISGYDGVRLGRELANPSAALASDPAYEELRLRCLVESLRDVSLSALHPDFRISMTSQEKARLFDTVSLCGDTPRERSLVERINPRPAGQLWLRLPHEWQKRALADAGFGQDNHDAMSNGNNLQVELTPELRSFMDRIGMVYGTEPETIAQHYYVEITDMGRAFARYQKIIGSRYIGEVDQSAVVAKISQLYAADPIMAPFRKIEAGRQAIGVSTVRPVEQAVQDPELHDQLRLLTCEGQALRLPRENLSRYLDIKRALEKAGGKYRTNKKQFEFATGIDPAEVLERLLGGDKINYKQQFQFFATNAEEARKICQDAGPLEGKRVLEPSAGDGAIADVAREMGADVVTVELWSVNAHKLREKGYEPIERNFLELTPDDIGTFDAICGNPPFSKSQDIDHFKHMVSFLRPGGSMSVIMSTAWIDSTLSKHVAFRDFLSEHGAKIELIEAGAFSEAGTNVATSRVTLRDYRPALEATPISSARIRRA